jgi:chromosome segregation ATPase
LDENRILDAVKNSIIEIFQYPGSDLDDSEDSPIQYLEKLISTTIAKSFEENTALISARKPASDLCDILATARPEDALLPREIRDALMDLEGRITRSARDTAAQHSVVEVWMTRNNDLLKHVQKAVHEVEKLERRNNVSDSLAGSQIGKTITSINEETMTMSQAISRVEGLLVQFTEKEWNHTTEFEAFVKGCFENTLQKIEHLQQDGSHHASTASQFKDTLRCQMESILLQINDLRSTIVSDGSVDNIERQLSLLNDKTESHAEIMRILESSRSDHIAFQQMLETFATQNEALNVDIAKLLQSTQESILESFSKAVEERNDRQVKDAIKELRNVQSEMVSNPELVSKITSDINSSLHLSFVNAQTTLSDVIQKHLAINQDQFIQNFGNITQDAGQIYNEIRSCIQMSKDEGQEILGTLRIELQEKENILLQMKHENDKLKTEQHNFLTHLQSWLDQRNGLKEEVEELEAKREKLSKEVETLEISRANLENLRPIESAVESLEKDLLDRISQLTEEVKELSCRKELLAQVS